MRLKLSGYRVPKRDKYCLKWNDFETNIRTSFKELREDQNYFDVTLATDDGQTFEAHKIILSTGSQFFSNILKQTKHPSPFIYLKGIHSLELQYVLDFFYNGEAFMAQEDLNNFLETAQELLVRGLQSNMEDENRKSSKVRLNSDDNLAEFVTNTMQPEEINQKDSISESLEEFEDNFVNNDVDIIDKEEDKLVDNANLDTQIEQMIVKQEGLWQCKVCGKSSGKKSNIQNHAEIHIEGVTHSCHICNKIFSTRHNLSTHVMKVHSESSLTCNNCG